MSECDGTGSEMLDRWGLFNANVATVANLSTTDASKVRLGGFAPTLATVDASKVRKS
jgi:hypothetical protein